MNFMNEFKENYFKRIEKANKLFPGVRSGRLQDRGRIFILFGPPTSRYTYKQSDGNPHEVWYYGNFSFIFFDHLEIGNYKLQSLT